jgi:hypothetical protein
MGMYDEFGARTPCPVAKCDGEFDVFQTKAADSPSLYHWSVGDYVPPTYFKSPAVPCYTWCNGTEAHLVDALAIVYEDRFVGVIPMVVRDMGESAIHWSVFDG